MMMCGHFAMAFESLLFPALALVALGNGLFIPPLAVQVARLYKDGDARLDQAISAYYMGINLGGFTAPLLCGWLGETNGWHWGFALAGSGMLVGLITYLGFRRHIPPDEAIVRTDKATRTPFSAVDRKAIATLLGVMAVVVLFRIAYEQSGNTIALWVSERTDRSLGGWVVPATWFQSINPLIIILLTPFLMEYWRKRKEAGHAHNLFRRMALGCALAGLAGVIGGNAFVTEPSMAAAVGSIVFVVIVVGGLGSLAGAFIASLAIGIIQTFAVALDWSLMSSFREWGWTGDAARAIGMIKLSQFAPVLPYILMVLILIFRPRGLLGRRDT
jgi:POT family proton-dependent oligopeptide transporter